MEIFYAIWITGSFFDAHVAARADVSVSVYKRETEVDFGVLKYDQDMVLQEFQEKPRIMFDVSMGIYCLAKRVVEKLPRGGRLRI